MSLAIAWTTAGSEADATRLAEGAVTAGLAACAQVDGPIQSTYVWQGTLETATEWRVTFKTAAGRLDELEAWVHSRHPYEVPQWITANATGSSAYTAWVEAETAKGRDAAQGQE